MQKPPLSEVYCFNFAIAHTQHTDDIVYDEMVFNSPTAKYWYSVAKNQNPSANPPPTFRIFQSSKEMQGVRNPKWNGEILLTESIIVKHHFVDVLGFYYLDEHLLTVGNVDLIDGWHFDETPKIFESMIFVNILCNNK